MSLNAPGGVWNCNKCTYNICTICRPLPFKLECGGKHPLKYFEGDGEEVKAIFKRYFRGRYFCDKGSGSIEWQIKNGVWHCSAGCFYDISPAWVSWHAKQESAEEPNTEDELGGVVESSDDPIMTNVSYHDNYEDT